MGLVIAAKDFHILPKPFRGPIVSVIFNEPPDERRHEGEKKLPRAQFKTKFCLFEHGVVFFCPLKLLSAHPARALNTSVKLYPPPPLGAEWLELYIALT